MQQSVTLNFDVMDVKKRPTDIIKITFPDTEENGDIVRLERRYAVPVPSGSHLAGWTTRKRLD